MNVNNLYNIFLKLICFDECGSIQCAIDDILSRFWLCWILSQYSNCCWVSFNHPLYCNKSYFFIEGMITVKYATINNDGYYRGNQNKKGAMRRCTSFIFRNKLANLYPNNLLAIALVTFRCPWFRPCTRLKHNWSLSLLRFFSLL